MKLLELYSLTSGLKIGKQHLLERFFPTPLERYITLHAASGMPSKNYSCFGDVISLIRPYLDKAGIGVIQLGIKEDPGIAGCHHLMGRTNLHQANYIVGRSMLHLGNDSIWAHRAAHVGVPLVALYGATTAENHGPYKPDDAKTILLSSHRWGRKPAFTGQENPASVNLICPFEVARSVLKLLGIDHTITGRTQLVGGAYNAQLLDFIPNAPLRPDFNPQMTTAVRMDLEHNENILAQVLQSGRKVNVLTSKPINLDLLAAFKANILSYNHEVLDDCLPEYLKQVQRVTQRQQFFSRSTDADNLSALRFKYFDVARIEQVKIPTREIALRGVEEYLNLPAKSLDNSFQFDTMMFKTQKYVLSRGKTYLSIAHERADKHMEGESTVGQIIDSDDMWRDLNHMLIFKP